MLQALDSLPQLPELPIHIGDGKYAFDCEIWSNSRQEHSTAVVWVDVPSLSALNRAIAKELGEAWCVSYWHLIT